MSVKSESKATQDKYKLEKLKQWKCEEAMKDFLDHTFRGADHLINIKKDYTAYVTYEGNYELDTKQKLEMTKYNFKIRQINNMLLRDFSYEDVQEAISKEVII